jgi:thiol-disulfide isomerase/thioredoxin
MRKKVQLSNRDIVQPHDVPAKKRKNIFWVVAFGIIIIVIVTSWYLFQPKDQENEGILAPSFSLTSIDGNSFHLSDFKGKVVLTDFMATWCGECRKQIPQLRKIWANSEYRNNIVIISVDVDPTESEETLKTFRINYPYATWIWARDTNNLWQHYQVIYIPKIVLINPDGYLRFEHSGVIAGETLIKEIDQILGE